MISDKRFNLLNVASITQRLIINTLHILVLVLSVLLILIISFDTFNNIQFYHTPHFVKYQFWICIIFLADFFIELLLSKRKWHYLWTHILFLIVSIPYLPIIATLHLKFSPQIAYLIAYIPLIRGGYALAIVVNWFTSNKATGLFWTYLITLLATVYFASLAFYLFEHHVNKAVTDYADALWWAAMNVTTVGCNIIAVTPVGRVLTVVLAALGMMMFPIFTVYVTSLIKNANDKMQMIIPLRPTDKFSEAQQKKIQTNNRPKT